MEPQADLACAHWEPTNRVIALMVCGPTAVPQARPPHIYKTISTYSASSSVLIHMNVGQTLWVVWLFTSLPCNEYNALPSLQTGACVAVSLETLILVW